MRCLVLERVPLVAEDLAMLIEECRPGTEVLRAASLIDAEAALDAAGGCDVAFLNTDPERFDRTALALMLQGSGAVVVFVGHEVEAARSSQRYLERPFSGAGVRRILELCRRARRKPDLA